jgi:hypothetical protein
VSAFECLAQLPTLSHASFGRFAAPRLEAVRISLGMRGTTHQKGLSVCLLRSRRNWFASSLLFVPRGAMRRKSDQQTVPSQQFRQEHRLNAFRCAKVMDVSNPPKAEARFRIIIKT